MRRYLKLPFRSIHFGFFVFLFYFEHDGRGDEEGQHAIFIYHQGRTMECGAERNGSPCWSCKPQLLSETIKHGLFLAKPSCKPSQVAGKIRKLIGDEIQFSLFNIQARSEELDDDHDAYDFVLSDI